VERFLLTRSGEELGRLLGRGAAVRLRPDFERPPELEAVHRKAVRLEWFSIVYLASAIAVLAAVLGSSGLPPVLLGRAKQRLAAQLHDKVLYADAEMNKADWATAGAAILAVMGIGAGLWWAGAVAGIVISLDIVHDGYGNARTAVHDPMDRRPTTYDNAKPLPLVDEIEAHLRALPWVTGAEVRLREEGHVLVGEAYVVPVESPGDVPQLVERTTRAMEDLDWRLHDVAVVVLPRLDS